MDLGPTDRGRPTVGDAVSGAPVTVCFPFAGGLVGGSHISALTLVRTLDRRQFTPLILLHGGDGPLVELLSAQGLDFELAPDPGHAATRHGMARVGATIASAFTLGRFLRRRGVRIVHTNEGSMHATWALPARLAGAKLLWHHRGNPRARGLRFLAPLVADRVVAVSRYASPRPGLISAASKCAVVYSPFDTLRARPDRAAARAAALTELGLSDDTRVLGFFGHLAARKRPLVFVEAIAAARRRAPGMPIVGLIFGDTLDPGLDVETAELAARLGVADHVRMMGFRMPAEPWLAACDLKVVTAVEEPFGRTLIEAMLLGTPVIAAASGGNIEAIRHGDTGLLVAPDQPEAFAEAIMTLLDDPAAAAAIAAAAQADALASFGIERHARSVTDIYQRLLAA